MSLTFYQKLVIKSFYKDGQLDGPYEEYSEDGILIVKGKYVNGKIVF
jgi:antitoxin component YwqK of YwqJK toxin-antitoxin module